MTHTAGTNRRSTDEHPHTTVAFLYSAAFLLELMMLTVLALAGAAASGTLWVRVVAAVVLPVIAATIWAVWMAPTSAHRLAHPRRLAAQVALFAVTALLGALFLAPWVGAAFLVAATAVFAALARLGEAGES